MKKIKNNMHLYIGSWIAIIVGPYSLSYGLESTEQTLPQIKVSGLSHKKCKDSDDAVLEKLGNSACSWNNRSKGASV
jgi:hypothetical protein